MITLHCCGEDYYADEMHIGGHIKCRKCGRFLTIEPKTPLSSTASRSSRYSVAAAVNVGRAWGRRRLPLLKLAFGGVLLGALVVWISFARFSNRDEQSTRVPERVAVSLRTGTWIRPRRGIAGNGVLKIENGTGLDAVVKLVTVDSPPKTVWMLYVRVGEPATVGSIAVGSYLLRFALGLDWDAGTRKFRRNIEFYQAGRQLEFTEIEPTWDEPGKYSEIEITLHEMVGGKLPRKPINETTFNEGDLQN